MGKLYLISVVILIGVVLDLKSTNGACILLDDCAAALQYVNQKRSDAKTITILRNAHCGFESINGKSQAKVFCERIPDFPKLPQDCVPFYECAAADELIKTRKFDLEVIQLLKSSECGDSEQKDMVLCNKITSYLNGNKEVVDSSRDKKKLLPKLEECGNQMPTSKLYGAEKTDLEDFGWLALIRYRNNTGHATYGCHGSLISKKYVVSAAHCFQVSLKLGKAISVVLGEYDISTDEDCIFDDDCAPPIQEFSIESIKAHTNFGSKGAVSDIALIRLRGEVTFSVFVKPICLPLRFAPLRNNEELLIAGWGKTETKVMSPVKLKAQINFLTKEDCENIISYSPDHTQICAGSDNGADTCRGDSGGPLMAQRTLEHQHKTVLVGVVSFGGTCGSRGAIYTNVTYFVDWILNNIEP